MISVIVPFYNAETTLQKCIDSILNQTVSDIEILLIDDGSTDNSWRIADQYNENEHVKVFHKENGGLASARNFGLDRAKGRYISFVDADDWIEANAYEIVLNSIGDADICGFGRSIDFPNYNKTWKPVNEICILDNSEAVKRLVVDGTIKHAVWDKMYKADLFDSIRFPEGHYYEDIFITHKILHSAQEIVLIPDILYHYVQYIGSITHTASLNSNLDLWIACYELYENYNLYGEDYKIALQDSCLNSIYGVWGSFWKSSLRDENREQIHKIVSFAKLHCKKKKNQKLHVWFVVKLAATGTRMSMFIAYCMNRISKLLHPRKLYR